MIVGSEVLLSSTATSTGSGAVVGAGEKEEKRRRFQVLPENGRGLGRTVYSNHYCTFDFKRDLYGSVRQPSNAAAFLLRHL